MFESQSAHYVYENKDDATMFWYHDHAMGITRYNVYAGLAGLYIVRSQKERNLNLPSGPFEIPLVLQDKNLDTDANGELTGKLLHKVVEDTMEFFGPFNLVNGKIWPYVEVERAVYRFRIINGSNARTYHLKLIDENNNAYTTNILHQIGSEGGFFKSPVALNNNELILASGERADIIADFRSDDIKGKKLTWVNIAFAPYNGDHLNKFQVTDYNNIDNGIRPTDSQDKTNYTSEQIPDVKDPTNLVDNANFNPYLAIRQTNINVIQFKISNSSLKKDNYDINTFNTDFKRITHSANASPNDFIVLPSGHEHRYIALVEEIIYKSNGLGGFTSEPMLMLRELVPIDFPTYQSLVNQNEFAVKITNGPDILFFRSIASMFYDPITFFIRFEGWEIWKILNLTHDTHPFHVHLVQFQALGLQTYQEDVDGAPETQSSNRVGAMNFDLNLKESLPDLSQLLDNEKGWKDTIRINPNHMMSIAMQFKGHTGRYMYHCHLLEHEDREMMRPFVVLPDYVVDNMAMGNSSRGHHH